MDSLEINPDGGGPVRATGRKIPIGAVAERYGVPATTLRYWEQVGLLPAQERAGGQRRYDRDAIRRIKFIRMASRAGLSLADIKTVLARHLDRSPTFTDWAAAARDQIAAIDQRIADLGQLRATIEECLACGCQHARRCKLLTTPPQRQPPGAGRRP
jgi:MerR family transcriptional regulator, redox-sensitive transcriptional activator SoxR